MSQGPLVILLSVIALCGCEKPGQPTGQPKNIQDEHAKVAAHKLNEIVGPIWPHDSSCYIWVHAQVVAGRLSREDEASGDPFAHCVDTSELEARKHPLTAERRATMDARRALGLQAQPLISSEKKD